MSDSDSDSVFLIYYGGKFEKFENGTVHYAGGSVHEHVASPQSVFEALPMSLYGQRVWYKLPYEDLSELKVLLNGFGNFEKMCEATKWTKQVEIYMESDEDIEENQGRDGDEDIDENQNNNQGRDGYEDRGRDEQNEGRDEERNQNEMCNEQARVEEIVATFVDEEENDDYSRQTHPPSDNERERNENFYESWRRGSGELKISQVFESVKEFREVVLEYALKGGWNIQYNRWGSIKSGEKCGIENCKWRIYCSYEDSVSQWMVKTFQEDHTCHKDGRCKILTDSVICNMFLDELRNDADLKPIAMQQRIHERYSGAPSHDQCRKAKKRALALIEKEWDE